MQVLQRKRLTRRPEDAPISQRKSSEAPKSIRKADRYTSIIYIQPSFKHQLPTRHFLFGYGSLINGLSRNRTLPRATKSFPVRVQGLSRTWSYPCPLKNYTAVSVEKTGCQRTFCNGVLIELDEAPDLFLSLLDARELNYRRSRIDLNSIVPYSYNKDSPKAYSTWLNQYNQEIVVWVYDLPTTTSPSLQEKHSPTPDCPIPQTYVDCILDGCLQYGIQFAQEFLQSTSGWVKEALLNDRHAAVAKRKYTGNHEGQHDPSVIDQLIEQFVQYEELI